MTVKLIGDPAPVWTEDGKLDYSHIHDVVLTNFALIVVLDWVDTSREKALASNDPTFVYVSEKVLAEKAVWDFADKHSKIDVTTGELHVNHSF